MSERYYAIVWINHNAAEVFRFNGIEQEKVLVNSHTSLQTLHHEAHPDFPSQHTVDTNYFSRIASILSHVAGTLLAGPGQARFELGRYLAEARPELATHQHEIEIAPRPGDAALVAMGRDYYQLSG